MQKDMEMVTKKQKQKVKRLMQKDITRLLKVIIHMRKDILVLVLQSLPIQKELPVLLLGRIHTLKDQILDLKAGQVMQKEIQLRRQMTMPMQKVYIAMQVE